MPAQRLAMRLVREVLRLKFAADLSHRQIARALRIGVGTVTNYLAAAQGAGLTWPLPDDLDDAALSQKVFPPEPESPSRFARPEFAYIHEQLRRQGRDTPTFVGRILGCSPRRMATATHSFVSITKNGKTISNSV